MNHLKVRMVCGVHKEIALTTHMKYSELMKNVFLLPKKLFSSVEYELTRWNLLNLPIKLKRNIAFQNFAFPAHLKIEPEEMR